MKGLSTGGAYTLAARHGAEVQWDDVAQVPYFTYSEGGRAHIVYFENSHSAPAKLQIVEKYGLGGIAIWRLGLNEPAIWEAVGDVFRDGGEAALELQPRRRRPAVPAPSL